MRNMSFMLTTQQMKDKAKFVTRRLGWKNLKIGEYVQAVEKCQGLKKGEKIKKICVIKIVSVSRVSLQFMNPDECFLEGFPDMTPREFIEMFCKANKCKSNVEITRIRFEYVVDIDGHEGLFGYIV